jgi:hypothetical protein
MPESAPQVIASPDRLRIRSLRELDALVGERLTREVPRKHWENARNHFRFASLEDALDALDEPLFLVLVPNEADAKPALITEVKEFRAYSTDLNNAWNVVECVNAPLLMRREHEHWRATFGETSALGRTAAIAICIAGLRANGIELEYDIDVLGA